MIDFKTINSIALSSFESLVQQWIPGGNLRGKEYVVKNPIRSDSEAGSFSINTESGLWKDFASGDGGNNPISLYAYINRLGYRDAANELARKLNINDYNAISNQKRAMSPTWTTIAPIPPEAPNPPIAYKRKETDTWTEYPIVDKWAYRDSSGALLGYDVKIINSEGKKEILPLTYCKSTTGETRWRFLHFRGKRFLYGIDRLAKSPDATIIVVEGCKCAKVLQDILDQSQKTEYVVCTWPGGCESVRNANWTPLKKRNVIIWPDNDRKVYKSTHSHAGQEMPRDEQPGFIAALAIHSIIKPIVTQVKIVNVPGNAKPDTWDVADAIYNDKWTVDEVLSYINNNLIDPAPMQHTTYFFDEAPFSCLGFDRENRYYMPNHTHCIKAIREDAHTKQALLSLAPKDFWMSWFPNRHDGVDWEAATGHILHCKESRKFFNARKVRGRGAWLDNEKIVVHLGNYLVADGTTVNDMKVSGSTYIYESGEPLQADLNNPLNKDEALKLFNIIEQLNFASESHIPILAGFIALAPICGALDWRPHLWLTGGKGTGKSAVMNKIVGKCLDTFALPVRSNTTSSGIMQAMRLDALAITFDESEGESERAKIKLQDVIELARGSSSETKTRILKGQANHRGIEFDPKPMFIFSSIGVNITKTSDESRITVIELIKPQNVPQKTLDDKWTTVEKSIDETLTPEYCNNLRARSIKNIKLIRKNCSVFSRAVSQTLSSRRAGDQLGTLLAGAYSLVSDSEISLEGALDFVKTYNFATVYETGQEDERLLLDHILQFTFKIDTKTELSVEEIIKKIMARSQSFTSGLDENQQNLYDLLKRNGIRIENCSINNENDKRFWTIWISDSHGGIAKILESTSWPKKWGMILRRLPGVTSKPAMRFIGSPTRATGIPLESVFR